MRVNSTRQPFSIRARPMAAARWLFPPPGGPNNRMLAPFVSQLSPAAIAITWALETMGTASKAKLSRVFPGGRCASARWRSIRRCARSASSSSMEPLSGPPAWDRRKRGTQNQAIGRSRGGLTTKILALVDALGNLVRFILLPGQRHDSIGVEPILHRIDFDGACR